MVSGFKDIDCSYEDQKLPDSVCVIEPKMIKMTHIASTTRQKTNEVPCKQKSMPNDAALYIHGIGNCLIAFTCTVGSFLSAYAGLLVNGLMIMEFACQEAQ